MKIYMIKGNNGEEYEDYSEWIESIYLSKENAKKELAKLRKQAKKRFKKGETYEEFQYWLEEVITKDLSIKEVK